METQIHKVFKPLYTTKKRYILVTGGRGSLKSTTVHDFIARLTYERGHGILFTRYTMVSAQKSIIPEFRTTLERLNIAGDFNITATTITNKITGSFIYFSGIKTSSGDQTGNLKSISGITTWVNEEGEDFKSEKTFDSIDNSIRTAGIQNRVIWIQNPTTKEHFIYQKFIKHTNKKIKVQGYDVTVSSHPEVEHIHTTYRIAEQFGYLSSSWLSKAREYRERAIMAEDKHLTHYYYIYIGGWLEKAEGVIFPYWKEGVFDETLPYCLHLDWGYSPDPLALGKIAVDQKRKLIYVKELLYKTEINDVAEAFENLGIKRNELIVCDTNEPRTKVALAQKGYNIQMAIKNRIVDDVRVINQYEIIVDPESPNFKAELNNYIWNDKKASIPIGDYNHLLDGMRYGFNRLVRKSIYQTQILEDFRI
jgi:phage terminase large subunit